MPATEPLANLARKVLDGAPIDWASAESSAAHDQQPFIRQLRVIEGIAAVHRREPAGARTRSWPATVFSNPARADAPERWGHLRILERIGRGAFGAVYRAWDSRLDREVALKLLPAPRAADDAASSTIIEEGRLLARVRHANVVTIHGAERIGDQIGLWMELVRGQTLEQLLQRGTTFTAADVTTIGLELCGAVSAVHAAGLLHRDIKAHNVTRADDGRIVLMDFGAGRELDDNPSSDFTGTPLYLAPEVFRGEAATVQSDLYCLGVLLYHLVTGKYPVEGRTITEVRAAHEKGERTPLKTARPDLPAALVRVIDRAIDPDPRARYQTAQALSSDLKALTATSRPRLLKYVASAAAVLIVAVGTALATGGWRPFGPATGLPRLAVLPFENLSTEPGSDAYVLGLTLEIQRQLATLHGIQPISAAASAPYSAKGTNLRQVGEDLRADYLFQASVFRSGDACRINARLHQVKDDAEIWNDSFDRKACDVFAVQDEIAKAIVETLRLKNRWRKTHVTRRELADLFMRARALALQLTEPSASEAARLYEQVVEGDSSFAPAWAGLAVALATASRRAEVLEPNPRMEEAARKAIALDPYLESALAAQGVVFGRQRRWDLAEKAFEDAIALNPSETETYSAYLDSVLLPQGRFEDVERVLTRALSFDPSKYVRRALALNQADLGHYDAAIDHARWVIARDPELPYTHGWLVRALYLSGQLDESLKASQELPQRGLRSGYLGNLYGRLGWRDDAEAMAARVPRSEVQMLIYAGLSDKERTFDAFERGEKINWMRALAYLHRPEIAPLIHGDPRVRDIERKLGVWH